MHNTELTLDQLSEFAGGQSLAQSSQGCIYQGKMLAETAIKTAATSAVTGAMQASTAATGVLAARVAASAPTGAM